MLAMDETMGIGPSGSMHLNTDDFLQQLQQMRDEGILAPDARIYAHHFSHHRNPIHPKLSDFFAPHGVEVAYDGLTIDL
jgi:phosphoribosyl 1,2-cyclic phosphate phosphodiesterase